MLSIGLREVYQVPPKIIVTANCIFFKNVSMVVVSQRLN